MKEKKNYVRCEAYHSEVKTATADKSTIIFKGKNSNGKDIVISITVDDYFFPYIIKDMAKIARKRVSTAISRRNSVISAVNEPEN